MAACVAPPAAPTIPVAPGPHTTLDRFGADQAACQQYAAAQIAPAVAAANNQAVGDALLGAALGAGLGAGIGAAAGNASKGAAIGAASGGALGIIGNAGVAPHPQESLQQQYDMMYGQCMAASGNSVPNFSPPPGTPPYSQNLQPAGDHRWPELERLAQLGKPSIHICDKYKKVDLKGYLNAENGGTIATSNSVQAGPSWQLKMQNRWPVNLLPQATTLLVLHCRTQMAL
jgi:hypothetical protein